LKSLGFVKQYASRTYLKRHTVKFRRRVESKLDFRAKKRLVASAKEKYDQPKFRLVVRITNKFVTTQIVKPLPAGDEVLASAYSSELPRYGLKAGLKNYAACYCTGLLIARRLLSKLGLADVYKGLQGPVTGQVVSTTQAGKTYYCHIAGEIDPTKKPFSAVLDVGISRCADTIGARIFAVVKGATDGGLDIPHNFTRFPGYNTTTKTFDQAELKGRILGTHIGDYMQEMRREKPGA
jgi:large subunit ribosomal protein L5e